MVFHEKKNFMDELKRPKEHWEPPFPFQPTVLTSVLHLLNTRCLGSLLIQYLSQAISLFVLMVSAYTIFQNLTPWPNKIRSS